MLRGSVGIAGGTGGIQPPVLVYRCSFWVKIGFKFQSKWKISNISTSDPPTSSFRLIPTLLRGVQTLINWLDRGQKFTAGFEEISHLSLMNRQQHSILLLFNNAVCKYVCMYGFYLCDAMHRWGILFHSVMKFQAVSLNGGLKYRRV